MLSVFVPLVVEDCSLLRAQLRVEVISMLCLSSMNLLASEIHLTSLQKL